MILIVGGIIMALRTDVPLSGLLVIVLPLMAGVIALRAVGRSTVTTASEPSRSKRR